MCLLRLFTEVVGLHDDAVHALWDIVLESNES
jgi:hypothetical protein